MVREDYSRGVALVLLAGCIWSIAGVVMRYMENANEWQVLFYRSLTLSVFLFFYIGFRYRGPLINAYREPGWGSVIAGVCLGVTFCSWIFAMTHTTIANALFVLASAPFITALLGRLILGEAVKRITVYCMIATALGILVMVIEGILVGAFLGNLFALGAAAGFSLFSVLLRRTKSIDMTPTVFWAGLSGTVIGAVMILVSGTGFSVSHHDFEMCALLGLVQVGIGMIIYTAGSKHVPAAELVLLSLTEVILGPLWVWLAVGEVPGVYTLVGGFIVFGAIVLQAFTGIQHQRRMVRMTST